MPKIPFPFHDGNRRGRSGAHVLAPATLPVCSSSSTGADPLVSGCRAWRSRSHATALRADLDGAARSGTMDRRARRLRAALACVPRAELICALRMWPGCAGRASPRQSPARERVSGAAGAAGAALDLNTAQFGTQSSIGVCCPGRCLTLRSHQMVDRCRDRRFCRMSFAGVMGWEAGVGTGRVVCCRAALPGGPGGHGGRSGHRGRGPVWGVAAECARVDPPL